MGTDRRGGYVGQSSRPLRPVNRAGLIFSMDGSHYWAADLTQGTTNNVNVTRFTAAGFTASSLTTASATINAGTW